MTNLIFDSLPNDFNLAHYLISKNKNNKSKVAVCCNNRSYTYAELNGLINEFQQFFINNHYVKHERIAFVLEDSLEFYVAFLAAISLGIIPVLVNPLLGTETIKSSILDAKIKAVLIDEHSNNVQLCEFLNALKISYYNIHKIVNHEKCNKDFSELHFTFNNKTDLAFIAYTSGSTGKPKGVMHAHYSPIVACIYYAEKFLKLNKNDIIFSGPSLAFTYGLGVSLYMPMYLGATTVLYSKKDAFSLVKIINEFLPTVFFGVPSHYASILSIKSLVRLDNKNLRLCISAGERLPVTIWDRWFDYTSVKICEGLGTTESTHIFISNNPNDPLPDTIGKPIPGYDVQLNKNGQLTLEGEGLMLGYWDQKSDNKNISCEKSIMLNDIYKVDANGFYRFIGRNDALTKIKGLWIYTAEIEEAALEVDEVQFAVTLIIENKKNMNLNEIVLIIQSDNNNELFKTKIMLKLKERLLKHQLPKSIYILTEIPLNSTGKTDRKKLHKIIQLGGNTNELYENQSS